MRYLTKISLACLLGMFVVACSNKDDDSSSGVPSMSDNVFYRGTTLAYAEEMMLCGTDFRENGVTTSPYVSVKNHGGNMIRVAMALPPYENDITLANSAPGGNKRFTARTFEGVKSQMQKVKAEGMESLLTFNLASQVLNPDQKLNNYVAPLAWQPIAADLPKLTDSVYKYVYSNLKKLVGDGLVPKLITIGNETNWRICEPNIVDSSLPTYDPSRPVAILNAGTKAVRDINKEMGLNMKVGIHLAGANNIKFWMGKHGSLGLDYDFLALSHYNSYGDNKMGTFTSWADVVRYMKVNYNKDFMIIETSQNFTPRNSDNVANLYADNVMVPTGFGYPVPSTTETQRKYMADFGQQLYNAGALGLIYWGGDFVGTNNCILFDAVGVGSSWDNKAFWENDPTNIKVVNLHDGINWMSDIRIRETTTTAK